MTLNPSAEINTNDLQSRGGVTSLYKVREKRKEVAKLASTHIARKKKLFGGGVLLRVFFFFAYEEVRTSRASSLCSSQLGY